MYDLTKILFIDIETVPQEAALEAMGEELSALWEMKFQTLQQYQPLRYGEPSSAGEAFCRHAGIFAEFGKIVCICVGVIHHVGGEVHFRTKSFAGHDEVRLLEDFARLLNDRWNSSSHTLCGHNIKEFDVPYICRRMSVRHIKLPSLLDVSGKKSWQTPFIDTMELWSFGDRKSFTSLRLLAAVLGIPSPKDDIDGSQVAEVYYGQGDLERIVSYCRKDVVTAARVFLRLRQLPDIPSGHIEHC